MAAYPEPARKAPPPGRQGPRQARTRDRPGSARRTEPSGATGRKASGGRAKNGEAAAPVRDRGQGRSKRAGAGPRARARINSTPLAYLVLIPATALLLLGLVMVFSANSVVSSNLQVGGYSTFFDQLAWAGLGILLAIIFARFDYHKVGKLSLAGVVVAFVLMGLVRVIGREVYGAKRWIALGPLTVQPTEIIKFAIVIFAAYVLAVKSEKLESFGHVFFPVVAFTLAGAGLMLAQPDLGSALVLCLSVMVVLAVAKTKASHLLAVGATGAVAALFFALLAPYRRARIFSFIDPWKTPRGAGYQVIQSYIALGTGNFKGLGLGMSRQKFMYLPNAHTDFIFSIVGEELGMAGTITVVCLVALLAYGGMKIAVNAADELGRLLAAGITGLIVIQALANMGGVTGLLPITGVPLPLVSSGGSSLCVALACIGILLNVAARSTAGASC